MGYSAIDIKERFQWTFPIVFSPLDPKVLYASSQYLWRTVNGGQSWEKISPNLTRSDPKTLQASGGPITRDQTGVETYAVIFTIAPSRQDASTLWTGSDDGWVHVTRDGAKTWTKVTPSDLPEFTRIGLIEASPHQNGVAYLAGNRYQLRRPPAVSLQDRRLRADLDEDRLRHPRRTTSCASSARIPSGAGCSTPAPSTASTCRSTTAARGSPCSSTCPTPRCTASWSRSAIWSSARTAADSTCSTTSACCGRPRPSSRPTTCSSSRPSIRLRGRDRNVTIDYYLGRAADEVKIEFLDAGGQVVRTFTGTPKADPNAGLPPGVDPEAAAFFGLAPARVGVAKGINRFTWDMRYAGRHGVSRHDHVGGPAAARTGGAARRYTVRITANGQTAHPRLPDRPRPAPRRRRHHARGSARAVRAVGAHSRRGQRRQHGRHHHPGDSRPGERAAAEDQPAPQGRDPEAGRRGAHAAGRGRSRDLPGAQPQQPGPAQLSDHAEQQDRGAGRRGRERRPQADGAELRGLRRAVDGARRPARDDAPDRGHRSAPSELGARRARRSRPSTPTPGRQRRRRRRRRPARRRTA